MIVLSMETVQAPMKVMKMLKCANKSKDNRREGRRKERQMTTELGESGWSAAIQSEIMPKLSQRGRTCVLELKGPSILKPLAPKQQHLMASVLMDSQSPGISLQMVFEISHF